MICVVCCYSLLSIPRGGGFSRDITTHLALHYKAFSRALKIETLKAPILPSPVCVRDINNWCIMHKIVKTLIRQSRVAQPDLRLYCSHKYRAVSLQSVPNT